MAYHRKSGTPVKLVFGHSSLTMKVALILTISLSTAGLLALGAAQVRTSAGIDALRTEAASLEGENRRLKENISELGTGESDLRIAREELGLVDPGSIVFEP